MWGVCIGCVCGARVNSACGCLHICVCVCVFLWQCLKSKNLDEPFDIGNWKVQL